MNEVRETTVFADWFDALPDEATKARVLVRIRRLSLGNAGDTKAVGGGVREMRLHWGPGYRIYYTIRGLTVVFLLGGGTKRSQVQDIRQAIDLASRV